MGDEQRGAISRDQAMRSGITVDGIRARVLSGRSQRVLPGSFVTFSGPIPRDAYLSALVLHAGAGAVLSHQTAAELHGLVDDPSPVVHVTVPAGRRPRRAPGIVVHRSNRLASAAHPAQWPPRTRIEDTVLDLTQSSANLDRAIGWITRACGRRLTTPDRLRAALSSRRKVRWRRELGLVLADVEDGCHSVLEIRFLRDVERSHGLPAGRRQQPVADGAARSYQEGPTRTSYTAGSASSWSLTAGCRTPTSCVSATVGGTTRPWSAASGLCDTAGSRSWQGPAKWRHRSPGCCALRAGRAGPVAADGPIA
ncbi:hypothetical protein GCM10010399_66610 [Dactylosporangium fulvum]|uniref:AbiEi antitoxin C-terminal domain-containing protein n=1 Tax=Dactylosporangium fulvum TaxID=53359 RepID=A0ABY5VVQ5_9ACTN|nr:type IV toxin-antitoxin system AbiEi family antitoxin [Dactylosporangium fulvum]UWP80896.1 hypothetical protein Dfulv_38065 [Dactylosporangium fulvum]